MPEVSLLVNGSRVSGWTSVQISKSIEKIADEFSIELTNERITASGRALPTGVSREDVLDAADEVEEDDSCEIQIDGQTVVTGYVFEYDFDYDANRASLVVSGASKPADLVDCSAVHETGVWNEALLTDIAFDICKPFGINVLTVGDQGDAFKRFKLQVGEEAFEAIARACGMRAMLPVSNEAGDLILCRASSVSTGARIERGVNVLRGGVNRNRRSIFSSYIFKGQTASSDDWSGKQASQLSGQVDDTDNTRYRPLIVLAQKQRVKEDLGKRAVWERNVRSGRSNRIRYQVPEWTWGNGQLWQPNMICTVKDDWCDLDGEYLVVSADFLLGDERVTALELMDRAAFDVYEKPDPPEKRKRRRRRRR